MWSIKQKSYSINWIFSNSFLFRLKHSSTQFSCTFLPEEFLLLSSSWRHVWGHWVSRTLLRGSWWTDTGWPPPEVTSSPELLRLSLCLPAVCSLNMWKHKITQTFRNQACGEKMSPFCFPYLLPLRRESQEWCEHQSERRQSTEITTCFTWTAV